MCVCVCVCMCVVFSYNTTFSRLCHAVCTPLCTNLLSVHTHVVPFAERTQSDFTWGECEFHVRSCGVLLLGNTLSHRAIDIKETTTGPLS